MQTCFFQRVSGCFMSDSSNSIGIVGTLLSALLGGGGWLIKYIFEENKKMLERFIELQEKTLKSQEQTTSALREFKSTTDSLSASSEHLGNVLTEVINVLEENTDTIERVTEKVDVPFPEPRRLHRIKRNIQGGQDNKQSAKGAAN